METKDLLHDLEPTVATLLDRHLATSKEWFPHEVIPYSRGRDFEPGVEWAETDADLDGAVIDDTARSSLIVNLLTEDNLPYYFRSVEQMFGTEGAWGTWSKRWTAEEGRHSMAIYGYLMTTRAVDPVALERARMAQVSGGVTPDPDSTIEGFAYLSMQELATRIAHRNTGKLLGDQVGYQLMLRVAADENYHQIFYRDLTTAALELDPSGLVCAIERQVVNFAMPGVGIPGFAEHAKAIARAGVYDLTIHHEQILVPMVLRHWKVDQLEGLDADAEQARERLMKYLAKSERVSRRLRERREAAAAAATTTGVPDPDVEHARQMVDA